MDSKKILLIEPNPYHTDGLPGIVKYFSDLQYMVDIYIQDKLLVDNGFFLYPRPINLYGYNFSEIRSLLSSTSVSEYDFVFFYSMEFTANGSICNILQHLGFMPASKYGILGIYHTTTHIDYFADHSIAKEGRLFCISDFQINNYPINSLAPIFFGNNYTSALDNKNTIICIGGAFDEEMLTDALRKISYKKKLGIPRVHLYGGRWQYGKKTIKRRIIAKVKLSIAWSIIYSKILYLLINMFISDKKIDRMMRFYYAETYIIKNGYVSFGRLFSELEKSKYILVLINPHSEDHKHYMSITTSGIRQIILGFNKIPIIHTLVAEKYGFDENNSIIFDDTNLSEVLLSINNDEENYKNKILALRHLYERIYSSSLHNLKMAIDNIIVKYSSV